MCILLILVGMIVVGMIVALFVILIVRVKRLVLVLICTMILAYCVQCLKLQFVIYHLLMNHFKPGPTYKFPSRPLDGCNRACQHKYLVDNPHFVYSKAEDACLVVVFAHSKDLVQFVLEKFNHWTQFTSHNSTTCYLWLGLMLLNLQWMYLALLSKIVLWKQVVKKLLEIEYLAEAILFCGRENIALRGHSSSVELSNRGNFLDLWLVMFQQVVIWGFVHTSVAISGLRELYTWSAQPWMFQKVVIWGFVYTSVAISGLRELYTWSVQP